MSLTEQQVAQLNAQYGEEYVKEAAARLEEVNDAYLYGFSKFAAEVADAKDKEDAEEKEEKEERKMDEESEKKAAELGAFIERGFFDGLRKLGSDRYGDELHYLAPYVQQKIAEEGETKKRDPHYLRRSLLGNPLSSAIAAPWGRKMEAHGQAAGHSVGEAAVGGLGGAAIGAGIGALAGLLKGKGNAGAGATAGALLGGGLGAFGGRLHGDLGRRGTEIHNEAYDKK